MKKKNSTVDVGTVLFSVNDKSNNKDFWDDTELIEHWERTVQQYRNSVNNKQQQSEKKKIVKKTIVKQAAAKRPASPTKQTKPVQQTLQPMNDDALSNLIMSWYYAGYYTALYQAQQQQQQQQQQEEEDEEE